MYSRNLDLCLRDVRFPGVSFLNVFINNGGLANISASHVVSNFNFDANYKQSEQGTTVFRKYQVSMPLFVSSNVHQGDEHFSVQSRGRQCAFMSLLAVNCSKYTTDRLDDWSRTTVNIRSR